MKIRYSPTSPYVRKVMVFAYETGLEAQIERIPTDVWAADTDITRDNPLGKVPALIIDDGTTLYDSPVICEYLDSLHGGSKLFPGDGPARWVALRQLALADGITDAAVLRLLEGRRAPELQSDSWIARQMAAVTRSLDRLESDAEAWGDDLTINHIAVGCTVGYLDFRFADDGWRAGRPKLSKWYERFAARPSMQATVPKDPI